MDGHSSVSVDVARRADWRRRIGEAYAGIRAVPNHGAQAWQGWRALRDHLFKTHDASPLDPEARADFKELGFFDYDPAWRFLVGTTNPIDAAPRKVRLDDGVPASVTSVMETVGLADALGRELTIYWIDGYAGGLFLPFADATSGGGTAAGGRYLLDSAVGADLGTLEDGRLVLDFNFAYNPSSTYTPSPSETDVPAANRVENPVPAGEKTPDGLLN